MLTVMMFPHLDIELIFSSLPLFLFEDDHDHNKKNNGYSDADRRPENCRHTGSGISIVRWKTLKNSAY